MSIVTIPLTRGKFALIDEADYPRVSQHRWHAVPGRNGCWYAKTMINGKMQSMHRFILNASPEQIVDHRNHDGLDNRRENIRPCTTTQNNVNVSGPSRRNKTGYIGVSLDQRTRRFLAGIRHNGKHVNLGRFDTPEEAARVRDHAARQYYGEYATLNFPEEANRLSGRSTFLRPNNTSGFRNVRLDKRDGRWAAYVCVDGKERSLGRFADAESAARAFDDYARANLPRSTRLNFPRDGEQRVRE